MKKAISISIMFIFVFFLYQWSFVWFGQGHEVHYDVVFDQQIFQITEKYQKQSGNYYDIMIENQDTTFYYTLQNQFNKQKKIIKEIQYFENDNAYCIYPILETNQGTYLQCIQDGKRYSSDAFSDQEFILQIENHLKEQGYLIHKPVDLETTEKLSNSTIYKNNLLTTDTLTLWDYKGIQVIKNDAFNFKSILGFDKYENSHGYLVGKYYIIPVYLSSRVLEFSEVIIVDIDSLEYSTLKLNYTLSSDTYINGVIDDKLYYVDPSNLLQIEINPNKEKARLIGSVELGGQYYNGDWQDINIYDFRNRVITFQQNYPEELATNFSYTTVLEGDMNYYFYNSLGEIYQVPKEHLDVSILLAKADKLSNFKVLGDTVYYVSDNTVYYFDDTTGLVPVLQNNELRYNIKNRLDINRKS